MHVDKSYSKMADSNKKRELLWTKTKQCIKILPESTEPWQETEIKRRVLGHFIIQRASRKMHSRVMEVEPPPPRPASQSSQPLPLHLCFSAWICQPLWNQFLHWRFRSIYIFQFIYTHYQEIARGRSNLSTCNIKPSKSFFVTLVWFWMDVIANQRKWNI